MGSCHNEGTFSAGLLALFCHDATGLPFDCDMPNTRFICSPAAWAGLTDQGIAVLTTESVVTSGGQRPTTAHWPSTRTDTLVHAQASELQNVSRASLLLTLG